MITLSLYHILTVDYPQKISLKFNIKEKCRQAYFAADIV